MANEQNLKAHAFTSDQSREKAAENGRKGGIASGKAKRRRKAFAEAFEVLLERTFTDHNGNEMQGVDALAAKVFRQAMDGDMRAIQFLRDTVGEMPVQRLEVDTIDPQARAEMDELLGIDE